MSAKKVGGGKLSRTETVTVRLDPKLRYLAELAARKHRRTLSSYIEWAIEDSLGNVVLAYEGMSEEETLSNQANALWDVYEADRFVKLAQNYPDLLTHDEQLIWKIVKENKHICHDGRGDIDSRYLRDNWEITKRYAVGEISQEEFDSGLTIPF